MHGSQRPAHGRRAARTIALQALFEIDTASHDPSDVLDRRLAEDAMGPETVEYARDLVAGVVKNIPQIDDLIQRAAPAWPFDQMAGIDRNIIRLALFETLFSEEKVPFKVAVNEAVELAKLFGSDSSSRFVNGVVGRIVLQESGKGDDAEPDAGESPA